MRRLLVLAIVCLAGPACSGGGGDALDRDALTTQIVQSVHGTVGDAGVPCVETFLGDRTDQELDLIANGGDSSLDRQFTDAIVACVDG